MTYSIEIPSAPYISNPIKIGTKVTYKGKLGTVEGPLFYKADEPWLFVKMYESHKQLSINPKEVRVAA